MKIGKQLRKIRKEKRMTLVELEAKSGVQIATLSRMENDRMTGTLESHFQIAKALGVDITELYEEIVNKDKKVELGPSSSLDVFVHSKKASYEMLTTKALSKKMMPVLLTIEPKGKTAAEHNRSGAEKFIYVLQGKIELSIGKEKYTLAKSNTIYFDSSLAHSFENKGNTTAKILSVVSPVEL